MKVAIIYSYWHYLSLKSYLNFSEINRIYVKESVFKTLSDLASFKTLQVLPDIYFDSFWQNLKYRDYELSSVNSENITLYCADLVNPFSCLVYSWLRKRNNVAVCFLYDGTLNLVMATPSVRHRLFDHIRNFVFAAVYNFQYPRKKRFLTGLDLDAVHVQLLPNKINATFDYKVLKVPLFLAPPRKEQRDLIVYIEQNIELMNDRYDYWWQMLNTYVRNYCPKSEIIIAKHPQSNLRYDNELSRKHQALEEDICDLQPSHVISHNSSALVNLRGMGYLGDLVALNPFKFTRTVGRSNASATEICKLFYQNKVRVVEL